MKRLIIASTLVLSASVAFMPLVFADAAGDALAAKLKAAMPGIPLTSVTPSPIAGIYEVVAGSDVIYMTADGKYMFQGVLVDFEARKNLTEARRVGIRAELLKQIKDDDTIVYAPMGMPKHTITVFTDPSCPYCRKLHAEVPELVKNGVKVRYVLYPRAGLDSPVGRTSVGIMCAKDRKAEMEKAVAGQTLNLPMCETHPLAKQLELGGALGLEGTPYIITDEGVVISGYRPAADILKVLNEAKKPS
jgi:thiol:disulfide interchange protein DsbC